MTDALPPLPEPQKECWIGHELFSAAQMRAYARAAVEAERERCARICDERGNLFHPVSPFSVELHNCAADIRGTK